MLRTDQARELASKVAAGVTLVAACEELGLAERSVRRWRAEGRRELETLSPEAQLALALDRAQERARDLEWRSWALEQLYRPVGLDDLLASLDAEWAF